MHNRSYRELFFSTKDSSTIFVIINALSLKCCVPAGQNETVHALHPTFNNVFKVMNLIN